jgi:predicted N-acetyltransferase YhbS
MYFGPARSPRETSDARALAAQTFGEIGGQSVSAANAAKAIDWNEPDFPGDSHVIVAVSSGNEVIGTIRLLPRHLCRDEETFRMAGLSSVCVAPAFRGQGLSRELVEAGLAAAHGQGYEIAALFGRRAVDRYYTKFDFWSISSHAKIEISARDLDHLPASGIRVRPLESADLPGAKRLHEHCYANCFGRLQRSDASWEFQFAKWHRQNFRRLALMSGSELVGYAIAEAAIVIELATDPRIEIADLLGALRGGTDNLVFNLSLSHPLLRHLDDYEVAINTRHCGYGGHMMRVLNLNAVADHLVARAERRAQRSHIARGEEAFTTFKMSFDGSKAQLDTAQAKEGALGLRATAALLGARLPMDVAEHPLMPTMPFDIAVTDHF